METEVERVNDTCEAKSRRKTTMDQTIDTIKISSLNGCKKGRSRLDK